MSNAATGLDRKVVILMELNPMRVYRNMKTFVVFFAEPPASSRSSLPGYTAEEQDLLERFPG